MEVILNSNNQIVIIHSLYNQNLIGVDRMNWNVLKETEEEIMISPFLTEG